MVFFFSILLDKKVFHQSILYLFHYLYRVRSMILRNLIFFLTFLFINRRFFHPFHKSNIKQYWWNIHLTEFVLKKKGNYNIVVTWSGHMILLIITFNNILLSLPITLIYHFVPDGLLLQCTKSYSYICWKLTFFHYITEIFPAIIFTIILLSFHLLRNNFFCFDSIRNCIFFYSLKIARN